MTTLTSPSPSPSPPERLLSVADLAALPSELPSGTVLYELDNGRLIIMPPPGDIHGAVESNVAAQLKLQGELKGHGKVRCGDVGIILWRDPDRVVGADAIFIASRLLPIRRSKEGYLETIPNLVFEVKSRSDTWPRVEGKVKDYLKSGVEVVWVADPQARGVRVYRPGEETRVLTEADTLTVEGIIPDFRMPVRDVFVE